jgi:excisionase family DNA binding protein
MNKWISTKEAMNVLGVGSTTIKRWSDEGTLPSRRTAGGHRRFRSDAMDRILRQQLAAGKDSAMDEWPKLLIEESDVMRIRSEIEKLHSRLGDWYRAADFLDNVMQETWSQRSDDDESDAWSLIAAGRLSLALSAISRSFAAVPTAPIALLATFGGPQLAHRVALVELCARSENIEVLRAEAKTSAKELAAQIRSWDQHLVVLCAADQCKDCDLLASAYHDVSTACQEQDVELAIGFAGIWPEGAGYGHYCLSFEDLKGVLRQLKLDTKNPSNN